MRRARGRLRCEETMPFIIAISALVGVIGSLLWYTNWAEHRIIEKQ